MPTIQIDIPAGADLTRAVDAFAARFGYQTTVPNGSGGQMANPENKNAFAKRQVAIWIKSVVAEYEANVAMESARATATASANALNIT